MAAPLMKCREATKAGADGVVPKENLATTCFGTTPPARPFVELDGLAGTPPNLGVSRTVLLAGPITERKSAGRKQRTYRPTSLKGEFQTPNCRFCAGSTEAAFDNRGGRKMSRKFKGSFFAQTIVLLLLTWSSVSAWAQVTINPGDILAVDPSTQGGSGGVIRIDPTTGAQTVVSAHGFFQEPVGIAIEADGNIVVADRLSGIIRVNPLAGAQTVVHAGPPFVDLFGIALEANGSILVADTGCASHQCFAGGPRGQAVYRVNPVTGEVTTVSSGVYLDSPYAIDVEANGNIVVADSTSNVSPLTQGGIIRINPVTGNQTVVSQGRQDFACPFGIAIEANGNILTSVFTFAGYGCSPAAIFRANPANDQTTVLSPHSIGWQAPFGMAVDTDGSILVAEESYKAIFRVNPATGVPTLVSQFGFLISPTDVAIARATAIPDLSVTNTDAVTAVTAGDGVTYTYTITVSNSGT